MKNNLLIIFTILMFQPLFSQKDSIQFKPSIKSSALSFNISGFIQNIQSNILNDAGYEHVLYKYYYKENKAFRVGLGIQINNTKKTTLDSINNILIQSDSIFKQSGVYFSVAHEFHMGKNKRLDPYFAPFMAFGKTGKSRTSEIISTKDTVGESRVSITTDLPGSSVFKVGLIAGVQYFMASNLSLGLEYNVAYHFISTGGDYSQVTINKPLNGAETVQRLTGSNFEIQHRFMYSSFGNFILTYSF